MAIVRIDTSALSFPLFLIPGHGDFRDGSAPAGHSIDLPPGTHHFQQISGTVADFTFEVTAAGTIDFDPGSDLFLDGRGTDTLRVLGFPVELDATALSHGLMFVIAGADGFLLPDQVHALTLVPTPSYSLQPTSGIVATFAFTLGRNGRVGIAPQFGGFADADNSRLTISGYPVSIDGRNLSHDLLPVLPMPTGGSLARDVVHDLQLIPAVGYSFLAGSGVVGDFPITLGTDGALDFPSDCDGFLTGRGTSDLVVDGYPVLLDARHADSDLLAIADVGVPAQTVNLLLAVLVPAPNYLPQTASGVLGRGFAVARDGSVSADPAVSDVLRIGTVPRLEIIGEAPVG